MYNNINKCSIITLLGASTPPVLRQYWRNTAPVVAVSSESQGKIPLLRKLR